MGSGYKDFSPGDVLTASDVDGYLMRQTVMTFASASARDTALSGVLDEGMVAYLEDDNVVTVYDGSAWQVVNSASTSHQIVTFTANGSFTKATYPWARSVRVRLVGGGGAGGGAEATGSGEIAVGGGGGGGGYSERVIAVSSLGTSETVTVGAGGTAVSAAAGNDGGTTSFGSLLSATGGVGGGAGTAAGPGTATGAPGDGGTGSTGDVNIAGSGGERGVTIYNAVGRVLSARGGSSMLAAPSGQSFTASGTSGAAGESYGGGGGAAANDNSQSARAGSAGADGIVIVEIFG